FAGTVTVGGIVPAFTGASARPTNVPPAGAGMSSVTVKVTEPPGAVVGAGGVSDWITGCSAGPRTRTFAFSDEPSVAVKPTLADCARPFTRTVALVVPASTVTPPLTTVSDAGS